jgi:hypothetical protein
MIAHENATKFREQESIRSKMLSGLSEEVNSISKISKFSNKIENSIISKAGGLDYTNTRFHNALIMRHDTE